MIVTIVILQQILKTTKETIDLQFACHSNKLAGGDSPPKELPMLRATQLTIALLTSSMCALPCAAQGGNYRGAPAGWPAYANGAYPAYQANYGNGPAYYVARPAT